jgi:hypothetical protein
MTPPRARSIDDERHEQNLRKFTEVDCELEKNTTLTRQALTESQSNRHAVKGLAESVKSLLHLYEEDKRERKEERASSESQRIRELQKLEDARKEELRITAAALAQHAKDIERLNRKFTWALGFIACLSLIFHEVGDLVSPLIRHLLQ